MRLRAGQRMLACLAVLSLLAAACASEVATQIRKKDAGLPLVVVSTSIWADVVANVTCGSMVEVETLIPPGGDPHAFEPSLRDRARMGEAALVVANGLLLEEGLEYTLDTVAGEGTPVFFVASHVSTLPLVSDDQGHEHEEEHGHEGDDPHVWFDPIRVSAALDELVDNLIVSAGLDESAARACTLDYQHQLAEVDEEISSLVAQLPQQNRKLVTSHDSLGYFADRYGFEVVGALIPSASTLAETSPAHLEELAETIRRESVPAIFGETQHSTGDVDALADRIGGVDVVVLRTGTLGEPGSGAETYIDFLRTNARLIVEGLG